MEYTVETIIVDGDSGHREMNIYMNSRQGEVKLKISERYRLLMRNLAEARKPECCYFTILHQLTQDQEVIISILVLNQEELESPPEIDFRKLTQYTLGSSEVDRTNRFQHVVEVVALTTKLIVDFAKAVPGFEILTKADQITLLKGCCIEIMMLRLSRKYDSETNATVFGKNRPYTLENLSNASMGDFADFIFNFCRTLYRMQVDNTSYALLSAIAIFSDWPVLLEPTKVEQLREIYVKTLEDYLRISRPERKDYFELLVSTLLEMRRIGKKSCEHWFNTKVYYDKLPPIIEELLVNQ